MIRFNLFGIPVSVQPFFWITLAVFGGALRTDSPEGFLLIALFVIAGFISILVHELGHSLAGRAFGHRSEIVLQAFGGVALFNGRFTRPQSFLVTAAGPAIQIALAFLALAAFHQFRPSLTLHAAYFLHVLYGISLFWAVLNLLPILPLDGGQIVNAILGPSRIRITLWISIVSAILGAIYIFQQFRNPIFPIFLAFFAWESWKALKEIR